MQVHDGTLLLSLPAPQRAAVVSYQWDHPSPHSSRGTLHVDRNSCSETTQALSLSIAKNLTLTVDCLTGLPALAALELDQCSLTSVPTVVTALAYSLTDLARPYNDALQLADGDIATLLALQKLRQLDLRKNAFEDILLNGDLGQAAAAVEEHLQYDLPLWSRRSLQHLVDLPNAFRAQHGHALTLRMEDLEESHWTEPLKQTSDD